MGHHSGRHSLHVALATLGGAVILLVPTAIASMHSGSQTAVHTDSADFPDFVAVQSSAAQSSAQSPAVIRSPAIPQSPVQSSVVSRTSVVPQSSAVPATPVAEQLDVGPIAQGQVAPRVAAVPGTTTSLIPATSSSMSSAPSATASTSAPITTLSPPSTATTTATAGASTAPPSVPSTTKAPTTSTIPTTAIPTTAIPTTAIPTTAIPTTAIPTTTAPSSTAPSSAGTSTGARDFFDDFSAATLGSTWGTYGWGGKQAPGHGAMGLYSQSNVFTSGGNMVLRTQYAGGAWTSAGVSSGEGFSAYQGTWEVRARFEKAKGVGFVFLLYPDDGSWPPEVDLAEGRVSDPNVMATLHWDPDNQQRQAFENVPDMTAWHTYGVIMEANKITYTLDGKPWGAYTTPNVPKKNMWIGFQTGAMSCPSSYECVAGNVPSAATPAVSNIYIDWVAHYK